MHERKHYRTETGAGRSGGGRERGAGAGRGAVRGAGGVRGGGRGAARPAAAVAAAAVLAVASLGLGGCVGEPEELSPQVHARAVALGGSAADRLTDALGTRLQAAMAEGGPAHAIAFCSERAQALTDSVARSLGEGWAIRRTTDRPRNPVNAPDPAEAEALRAFQAAESADAPLEEHVQRTADGAVRYYRPLRTAGLCLECHGTPERVSPEVAEVLAERYPADAAVGYEEGDLRGVIRVTIPARRLAEPAGRGGP